MGNLADYLKFKKKISSEARRHSELFRCKNNVWEVLQTISICRADHTTNMATLGSFCF
jgi:hypothetical protein